MSVSDQCVCVHAHTCALCVHKMVMAGSLEVTLESRDLSLNDDKNQEVKRSEDR